MTCFFIKRREDTETQGRKPCEGRGRDWSGALEAGMEKTREDSSLEPLEGVQPC